MATCEGCGGYRFSETRVSGLCKKCWQARANPRRRVPLSPGVCVVCRRATPLNEGGERRAIKWVMDFLGGPICTRCHVGFSMFSRKLPETEDVILAWLARQIVRGVHG